MLLRGCIHIVNVNVIKKETANIADNVNVNLQYVFITLFSYFSGMTVPTQSRGRNT